MIENETILVTGGAGFIGSAFIRYVLNKEDFAGKIINLDLLTYAGNLENVEEVSTSKQYVFIHGDILDDELLQRIYQQFQFRTIVHFAAESHVDRSIENPLQFVETNVLGTLKLLQLVRMHPKIHFHHVSTDEVFGSIEGAEKFTERSPYQPNSPYAASKASSDHFVRAFARTYKIATTLSYSSNNFGPYQHREKFIPLLIDHLLQQKPLPIYGNGKQVRDWLYVDDHADAIWKILQAKERGEVYAIGGGNELKNIDLAHLIITTFAQMMSCDREDLMGLITHVDDRPGHDFRYALDAEKIQDQLGWKPKACFEDRLKETILWYIHQRERTLL